LTREAKTLVTVELDKMGYEQIPSQANFIMFDCKRPVVPLIQAMKQHKVHVGRLFPALPTTCALRSGRKPRWESFVSAFKQVTA
jgi:histidinol-phosphate/aromatic aminotransferase/cobyric acid decarboxylase-like protein